jgi:hexosaminidase
VQLVSHPELAESGQYSKKEVYTIKQIKDLIAAAQLNAVSIVPEFDTPAHVRSWGLSAKWNNISITCANGTGYNGQFDLSKP